MEHTLGVVAIDRESRFFCAGVPQRQIDASRTSVNEETETAVAVTAVCAQKYLVCGHLTTHLVSFSTADQALAPEAVQELEEAREDRFPRLRRFALR